MGLLPFQFRYRLPTVPNTLERSAKLIAETEAKLRELVSEAATSGDYPSVVQIASWARSLSEILNRKVTERAAVGEPSVMRSQKQTKASRPTPITKRDYRSYPKFFRKGDEILRIAWSKREKREYRHKSTFIILKLVAKAMVEKGSDGRVFATEEFLPIRDPELGEIPNYQSYVGIAFFKQCGLIDQHGRQGYSIPNLANFSDAVEAVWKKIPLLKDE